MAVPSLPPHGIGAAPATTVPSHTLPPPSPQGPASGGTPITVTGTNLGGDDPDPPTLSLCGTDASDTRPSASDPSTLLATTPPLLDPSTGDIHTGTTACTVRVRRANGRYGQAPLAFSFVGPPGPPPSQPPINLDDGWTPDALFSVGLRVWPYVLTALAGLYTLHWAYSTASQLRAIRRLQKAVEGGPVVEMSSRTAGAPVGAGASAQQVERSFAL